MNNIDILPSWFRRTAAEEISTATDGKFLKGDYPHISCADFDVRFEAGNLAIFISGRVVAHTEESGGDGRETPMEIVWSTETEIFKFAYAEIDSE